MDYRMDLQGVRSCALHTMVKLPSKSKTRCVSKHSGSCPFPLLWHVELRIIWLYLTLFVTGNTLELTNGSSTRIIDLKNYLYYGKLQKMGMELFCRLPLTAVLLSMLYQLHAKAFRIRVRLGPICLKATG